MEAAMQAMVRNATGGAAPADARAAAARRVSSAGAGPAAAAEAWEYAAALPAALPGRRASVAPREEAGAGHGAGLLALLGLLTWSAAYLVRQPGPSMAAAPSLFGDFALEGMALALAWIAALVAACLAVLARAVELREPSPYRTGQGTRPIGVGRNWAGPVGAAAPGEGFRASSLR